MVRERPAQTLQVKSAKNLDVLPRYHLVRVVYSLKADR